MRRRPAAWGPLCAHCAAGRRGCVQGGLPATQTGRSRARTQKPGCSRLLGSLQACDPHPTGAGLGPSTQPSRPSQTQPLTPSHPSGTASTGHLLFFTIPPIARPATTGLCIRHRPPRTRPVSCPHGIAIAHPRGAPPELAAAPEAFGWPGGRRLTGSIDAHQSTCLTRARPHTTHTHTHAGPTYRPTNNPNNLTYQKGAGFAFLFSLVASRLFFDRPLGPISNFPTRPFSATTHFSGIRPCTQLGRG